MQTNHTELSGGRFRCVDGQVGRFTRFVTHPTRRSISFGAEEMNLLHTILTGVQMGKDLRVVARHRLFPKLAAKVQRMHDKSKAAALAAPTQTPN